jgi:predicted N-acyltransferase
MSTLPLPEPDLSFSAVQGMAGFTAAEWATLPGTKRGEPGYNPFISYAFLSAVEESGSAVPQTGWAPLHLRMSRADGTLAGAVPCYVKSHSQGEYVFDHGWADAYGRAGGNYYPKLQAAVPFTPATGPRLLAASDSDKAQLAQGLAALCAQSESSSVHITFAPEAEVNLLERLGWLHRTDQQFHFIDRGYGDFTGFLGSLASRKRKDLRKEREKALEPSISIEWLTGSTITEEALDAFFLFYIETGSRKWGRPYLTRAFFTLVAERMADDVLLVMARRNGRYIAGAINFIGGDALYGRNWGCIEQHPFLHFEVCYYQAIDFALSRGLSRVEAGAQGEHKLARGYEPVTTHSAHHIRHPGLRRAVADYLERERAQIAEINAVLAEHTPFRKGERVDAGEASD